MGNCCNKQETVAVPTTIEYYKTNTLAVACKNYLGKIVSSDKVTFENTSPFKIENVQAFIGKKNVKIHGCIVPGIDPRGEIDKECQDDYIFLHEENSILCALFDGHGKEGKKIANFCTSFLARFHSKNILDFQQNPEETLTRMLHKCDEKLKRGKIRDEMAGSTAVAVYITETGVYSASLGDSRAIIATVHEKDIPVPKPTHKYYKQVTPRRHLKPVPLTTDQKPNHEDEFARIKAAGGSVEQITDNYGKRVGPYRVWIPGRDHPGLAMSRSIGDRIAKSVGVIATPVCHNFSLYETDQFIVIASDGVWDVMENIEVINFVDAVKKNCNNSSNLYPARPENSNVARLLCEEARYRWYGIIEDEDVMIDDISCIVIDFEDIQGVMKSKPKERNVKAFQSLAIDSEIDTMVSVGAEPGK